MTERLSDFESSYNAINSDERKRKRWRDYVPITIEPAAFLFCLGTTFSSSVTTDLFLVHTCENSLGYNHSVCMQLGDKTFNDTIGLEAEVQHLATYYTLGKTLIESILPTILSFYIGPWSDRNGRKPIIMWPMLGFALSYLIFMVESFYPTVPVVILMVSSVATALCGGFVSFIMGMYSYITDVTKPENRTLRLAMLEVSVFGGFLASSLTVPHVYRLAGEWGYVTVYAVSAACCLLAWLYCLLFVQESVINEESEYPCCFISLGLFKNEHFLEMISTCSEKRPNNAREKIFILFFVLGSLIAILEGETAVLFLFTRRKFDWDLNTFSTFAAVAIGINIVGLFFGTRVLGSWMKLSPGILTVLTLFLKIISSFTIAFSPSSWYMYLGAVISLPGACVGPWCRSILTTCVPKSDIGKIFAFVSSVESLLPLASGPLYTALYNVTLKSFPGAFWIISAGIFLINMLLIIRVEFLERSKDNNLYLTCPVNEEEEESVPIEE